MFGDARDWFFKNRIQMCIHFGLYSIEGWHEQDQMRRRIPRKEYGKLIERFNPKALNPREILDFAESAGMKHMFITAKHHDGFCLWDTAYTEFNVMNSPYGRDIIGMFSDECHRRNLPLGLYYSIADWHHPNYPNLGRHHELPCPQKGDEPDWDKYMEFLKNQVRELCTNYGTVNLFAWDMNVPKHQDRSVNDMLRKLQPQMVINDRGFDEGDFGTPEREYEKTDIDQLKRFTRPTEACNSVGTQSWGYRRDEDYYSSAFLIRSVDEILAKGGNYRLNVGPDGNGQILEQEKRIVSKIGNWFEKVRESFDAEPASELTYNKEVLLTKQGNAIFVHLTHPPKSESVILNPISQAPDNAILLNTGKEVRTSTDILPSFWQSGEKYLVLKSLPVEDFANETLVVKLEFSEPIRASAGSSANEFIG